MKRKALLIMLLMAMFAPLAMNAQETLTVYEGTVTNQRIPAYIYYFDEYTRSQFVIPAAQLGDMENGTINSVKFYTNSTNVPYPADNKTPAPVVVYVKEVGYTSISAFETTASCTTVYTGTLEIVAEGNGGSMTITFSTPYTYGGGNLLIGFENTETASWQSMTFLGQTVTGAAVNGNSSSSLSAVNATVYNFIPKTTFDYTPGEQQGCGKPKQLAVNYEGGNTATVTWTGDATSYNIDVNGTVTEGVTSPYTLSNLDYATTYAVKMQADCGGGDLSEWTIATSFTTDACAASDMCEITLALIDSYGDGWSGNAIKVVDAKTNEVLGQYTVSSGSSSATYTLAICDGRDIQFQWVAGGTYSYPDECEWAIYDRNGEVITEGEDATGYTTGQVLASHTVDCTVPSCFKPQGLAINNITNESAVITWTAGDENQAMWNLQYRKTSEERWTAVNGLRETRYTLDRLTQGTVYEVQVQGDCREGGLSDWTNSEVFTTALCTPEDMCEIIYELYANYTNGWSYQGTSYLQIVDAQTDVILANLTENSGSGFTSGTLAVCDGRDITFQWITGGNYESQLVAGFVIYDANGEEILYNEGALDRPYTYSVVCPTCIKPSNLVEDNITINSADLSWEGTSDSYMLQYRPWNPAGDDIITTGTMTTYTVDLSQYEGTGSVAIRHYDISDMFQLIVDDIEVTNAAGTVVYSQDFEDCDGYMPSEFSNMDLDGDGYTWQIASSPSSNVNGSYGIVSESYNNQVGALTPDNWLILSGLEMGGQMTFQARGQDPAYAAENFAIYVSTEASIVEVPVTTTSYTATNLTPNTPYAWQVKSICGDEETSYASSFFKTKDDVFVFATANGNWNDVASWTDADGNAVDALPTADNNVRIDAAAIIPANCVAEANKVTLNGGTITIKDGGQLKQSSATLRVTVEKEITAYGESDGNYYFISSPFNGRTKFGNDGSTWSLVDNILEGDYDLYAFDPTEELEWINYKANPEHISFLSEPTSSGSGNPGMLYGEGYLYANKQGTTLEFIGTTGKSNNYSETRDYIFDGESTDDWNGWKLVGNMFTCNGYINYIDADGNVLEADFYTMNAAGTGYDLSSSDVALAPCTGALINYSATGKVQYSTEVPSDKRSGMLNMTVTQGRSNVDQARIRFGQGFNLGKMSFRNSSKLYIPQGNKDYAVVYSEGQGEMPVSFKAENNGTYTLSFTNTDVDFRYLHLIDNMTGNDVDLLVNPSYSFEAKTTDYASRFRLVFSTGSFSDDNFAFYTNGTIVISNDSNATLKVYDVTGRMVNSQTINGSCQVNLNATPGVYMIQLVNGDNTKTQKIVVK